MTRQHLLVPVGVLFHSAPQEVDIQELLCSSASVFLSASSRLSLCPLGSWGLRVFIGIGWGHGGPGWSWKMQHLGLKTGVPVLTSVCPWGWSPSQGPAFLYPALPVPTPISFKGTTLFPSQHSCISTFNMLFVTV